MYTGLTTKQNEHGHTLVHHLRVPSFLEVRSVTRCLGIHKQKQKKTRSVEFVYGWTNKHGRRPGQSNLRHSTFSLFWGALLQILGQDLLATCLEWRDSSRHPKYGDSIRCLGQLDPRRRTRARTKTWLGTWVRAAHRRKKRRHLIIASVKFVLQ